MVASPPSVETHEQLARVPPLLLPENGPGHISEKKLMMEKLMTASHRNPMGRLSRSLFSPVMLRRCAGQAGAERSTVKAALIVSISSFSPWNCLAVRRTTHTVSFQILGRRRTQQKREKQKNKITNKIKKKRDDRFR
jgi:hypothetical protein